LVPACVERGGGGKNGSTRMAPSPPPPRAVIRATRALLAPWRWLTKPRFYGTEHVPMDRPVLLVGNHTLMGVLDVPLMMIGLWEQRGLWPRPLGDHAHFAIPGWRELVAFFGTVEGTRQNCRDLMQAGESILVFPGGAREVFKRKGEQYRLRWSNRMGFARLAVEHGYPIVPFAAVGADDCYEIVLDAGEVRRLLPPVRWIPRSDEMPPLVRGVGPTVIPRPQRFYFSFAEPVETAPLRGRERDDAAVFAVREQVRTAVEAGLAFLLAERRRDPRRRLLPRVASVRRGASS